MLQYRIEMTRTGLFTLAITVKRSRDLEFAGDEPEHLSRHCVQVRDEEVGSWWLRIGVSDTACPATKSRLGTPHTEPGIEVNHVTSLR